MPAIPGLRDGRLHPPPLGTHWCSECLAVAVPNGMNYCARCREYLGEQVAQVEEYWKVANNLGEQDSRYWREIQRMLEEDQKWEANS